jgi:Family of unknown function (DUF5994)
VPRTVRAEVDLPKSRERVTASTLGGTEVLSHVGFLTGLIPGESLISPHAGPLGCRMAGLEIVAPVDSEMVPIDPEMVPSWEPSQARVRFRQPVSPAGFVDASWWPRSRDLSAELPPLLDVLWTAGRDVNRVLYNLEFWKPVPRHLIVAGRSVRLAGFRQQSPLMIGLMDAWGRERIDVLVVDPDTDCEVALRALTLAGRADGSDRAERIMQLAGLSSG